MSIEWLLADERRSAISIDKAEAACSLAKKAAKEAGVADRFDVVELDIADLTHCACDILKNIDVIEAGFVLHDHLAAHGEEATIKLLSVLKDCLELNGKMVITDATRSETGAGWFGHIFSIIHEIQGIILPTDAKWRHLFSASGFDVESVEDAIMPLSRLYTLTKSTRCATLFRVPFFKEVHGHHDLVPFYFDSDLVPGISQYINAVAVVDLSKLPQNGPAQPHRHEQTEWYLLPDYPDPVQILVTVEEETFEATSPCLIKIPAGSKHSFRPIKVNQGSFIFGLFGKETK